MPRLLIDGDMWLNACIWNTTSLSDFTNNFNKALDEALKDSESDDYLVCLGGDTGNFRLDFYPEYKQIPSRIASRKARPPYFSDCKLWLKEDVAHVQCADRASTGFTRDLEADDLLCIYRTSNDIVASDDKDLKQMPGKFFYAGLTFEISPEQAKRNLDMQLLAGDSQDRIPGIKGIGPKKAAQLLLQYGNALAAYRGLGQSEELFLFNGSLVYLLRDPDETFSVELYERLWTLERSA